MKKWLILFALFVLPGAIILFLASGTHNFKKLRYYGQHTPFDTVINGEAVVDTIYYTVPPFSFTNQDGQTITQEDVKDKVYIANFFFASCPTICPVMTNQLKRAQYELREIEDFRILSHTVDPKRDTIEALQAYAKKYYADTNTWHFLRGSKEYTYEMGRDGYYLSAHESPDAPGGFLHSEMIVLIDKDKHIRGFYDGTNSEEIDRMVAEVKLLYKEEDRKKADAERANEQ